MHAQIKVALEFPTTSLTPGPHNSAPRVSHPRVSRCLSARGAGTSPAGLSAAIFPPRLGFFPAGGVASTPAAGLAAVLDLSGRLCAHLGSGFLGSGLGSGQAAG